MYRVGNPSRSRISTNCWRRRAAEVVCLGARRRSMLAGMPGKAKRASLGHRANLLNDKQQPPRDFLISLPRLSTRHRA